ncbi:MAG: mechanosensitive ion channel family protein [Oscillospiraceae bacterium]|nr:mechanosensitive ion channel family protein [Oscillospiraceae bacterium]
MNYLEQGIDTTRNWFRQAGLLGDLIELLIAALVAFIAVIIILKVEKKIFSRHLKVGNKIQLRFWENTFRVAIVLIAIFWVITSSEITGSFGKIAFQGTAIIGAIIGFAAQPVISDLICGFMLSASKPFDIGDRLELDGDISGIVKDITIRHVVIRGIDKTDIIIPNSKLNGMSITNMSQHHTLRSMRFTFPVAYGSDIDRAMTVIRKAVEESPYTVPGYEGPDGKQDYGPVYFMSYESSSMSMVTTAYYQAGTRGEIVRSDVNVRVNHALRDAGIEIPYNYMNVVIRNAPDQDG